jgi:hypothetical protein
VWERDARCRLSVTLLDRAIRTHCGISQTGTIVSCRHCAGGVSDGCINELLGELKKAGKIEPLGTGRGARWRWLADD